MDTPEQSNEPGNLRFLRILVTILTASMILGLVTIIVLIVIRVPNVIQTVEDPIPLPESIELPDGSVASSFTMGKDWIAVVTHADQILIFDRADRRLRQTIQITPKQQP